MKTKISKTQNSYYVISFLPKRSTHFTATTTKEESWKYAKHK